MGTLKDYIPLAVNTAIGLILIAVGEKELGVGILVAAATGRAITMGVDTTRGGDHG